MSPPLSKNKRPIHARQTDLFGQDALALFQKSKLFDPYTTKPFLHGILGSSRFKPPALYPFHCVRAEFMKVGCTGANPAAMRSTERNDCLSRKIITLQKRTDNPGSLPVPYGIANQNRIIAVHILHTSRYSRACIRIVLLLIGTASRIICQIRLRIRLLCYNFVNICPQNLRRLLC